VTALGTVAPSDLAVDRELADIAQSFRFILDLTPVDVISARQQFGADGRTPQFQYRPLEDDGGVVAARLGAAPVDDVEDLTLRHLLLAKRREIQLQLAMLSCRDSKEFLPLSIELYGAVSPDLLAEAQTLLDEVAAPPPDEGPWLDADSFVRRARQELDHYRAVEPDVEAHVEIRDGTAGVMVSNGELLVAPQVQIPESRLDALLQHEVGTHVVTHLNGAHQPLHTLGAGLAGYEETQEGLAVLAEHLVGGLTAGRLRELAARVVAVHLMVEGEPFVAVHQALVDAGFGPGHAFTITMRVFRSGGLTKDAVYLRGLHEILRHLESGGELEALWLGKMALSDVPLVTELWERGVLHDPLLRPRYLGDDGARARLRELRRATSLRSLIGDGS
jgi:uncharacterized protein (TIGR02421 family)